MNNILKKVITGAALIISGYGVVNAVKAARTIRTSKENSKYTGMGAIGTGRTKDLLDDMIKDEISTAIRDSKVPNSKAKDLANSLLIGRSLKLNEKYHRDTCHGVPVGNAVVIGKTGKGHKY